MSPAADRVAGFFSSGTVVDLILAVLAAEVVLLTLLRRSRRGIFVHALVAALPGLCLLLALRAALTGAGWPWIAVWLTLSFPAHLADLWRRPP